MEYSWDFSSVWRYKVALFEGLIVTLQMTVATIFLGTLIALLVLLTRKSRVILLVYVSKTFVEVFRNLPVLVIMFWIFYCIPPLLQVEGIKPIWVAIFSLSLNFAALTSEILRSSYDGIPEGQIDSARWLGLSHSQIFWTITMPQAFWRSMPAFLGQIVNTLKLTSLASFISVQDLFHRTTELIQSTFRPLEFYTVLALLYFVVIYPLSFLVNKMEAILSSRFRDQ